VEVPVARSNAVRLALASGGLALWCLACLGVPQAAFAEDAQTLTALNQQLTDIAATRDPGKRAAAASTVKAWVAAPPQKASRPFKPFPGLVDGFKKVERLMHVKSADGNFDANLWGAFAGGRGMSIKYHVIVR
jgi:hypothetical protein